MSSLKSIYILDPVSNTKAQRQSKVCSKGPMMGFTANPKKGTKMAADGSLSKEAEGRLVVQML